MKKKVIHYLPGLVNGGIEAMLLNYYGKLNDEFAFDIIVHKDSEPNCKKKFENLGSKIFQICSWMKNPFKNFYQVYRICKNEKPDIFHSHHNLNNFIPCFAAMMAGVKVRISHSHLYMPTKSMKQKFYSFLSRLFSTNYAACGIAAAIFSTNSKIYEKNKVQIIDNAINLEKFKYNAEIRNKIRKQYHWENSHVYGNVGRYADQKNQLFLVDIFKEIAKWDKNAKFVIIGGDGPQYLPVLEKVSQLSIKNDVLILKNIDNVNEFYQAMDVLLLPSFYEGLAVAEIEAQISHLSCVVSDTITQEFESDTVYFASSTSDTRPWMKQIKKLKKIDRSQKVDNNIIKKYDINQAAITLKNYYLDLIEGSKK